MTLEGVSWPFWMEEMLTKTFAWKVKGPKDQLGLLFMVFFSGSLEPTPSMVTAEIVVPSGFLTSIKAVLLAPD